MGARIRVCVSISIARMAVETFLRACFCLGMSFYICLFI
jgi:hypothetical protein